MESRRCFDIKDERPVGAQEELRRNSTGFRSVTCCVHFCVDIMFGIMFGRIKTRMFERSIFTDIAPTGEDRSEHIIRIGIE